MTLEFSKIERRYWAKAALREGITEQNKHMKPRGEILGMEYLNMNGVGMTGDPSVHLNEGDMQRPYGCLLLDKM